MRSTHLSLAWSRGHTFRVALADQIEFRCGRYSGRIVTELSDRHPMEPKKITTDTAQCGLDRTVRKRPNCS